MNLLAKKQNLLPLPTYKHETYLQTQNLLTTSLLHYYLLLYIILIIIYLQPQQDCCNRTQYLI